MPEQIPLTISCGLHSLPIDTLLPQLWQLSHQTVEPLEILIISMSPDSQYRDTLRAACVGFPLVRVIDAPQYTPHPSGAVFNGSLGANIAIKQSNPAAQFISCLSAGLLFNETALEALGETMAQDALCEAQMRTIPADYDIGAVETLWQRWGDLVEHINPHSLGIPFAPGSLLCLSRAWLFKVHGYDETNYPLAYNDSDIHHRASMDGIHLEIVPFGKMQVIHIDHDRRYALPAYPDGRDQTIIRNGEHWGEIEASA